MSEKTSKGNNSSSHQEAGLGASSSKNSKSGTNMFGASNWNETLKDMPKPDLQEIMKSHRKNVETVKQAQQMASELFQSLSTLNNQYMRQSFEELDKQAHTLSGSFKNFDKPGVAAEAVLEAAKNPFERAMGHCKQATELVSQSTMKIFDAYKKRFEDGLTEARLFLKN